jgi:hypothetical protein
MPIPELTDEESKAVIAALKKLNVEDNSLSPLLNPHKSALAKLDPRTPNGIAVLRVAADEKPAAAREERHESAMA